MTWPVFGSKNSVVRLVPQIEMISIHKAWWKWVDFTPQDARVFAPGIWNRCLDSGIPISLMIPPVMKLKLEDLNILWTVNSPNLKLPFPRVQCLGFAFELKDVLLRSGKGSLPKLSPVLVDGYTEGLKDRRNYTNFSNRRCKISISPTRRSDRRYSCCKSSVSRGFERFLKTDLMTIFYSSPLKNCKKKHREKSIFYSLSIWGVAEVALNQCCWGATHATNTVWGVPDQKMQKHLVKVVFAGLLPFEDFRMKSCKDGRNFR